MFDVGRTDRSVIGHWWWTIDHWLLLAIILLIGLGAVMIMAASPAVADRILGFVGHIRRGDDFYRGPPPSFARRGQIRASPN